MIMPAVIANPFDWRGPEFLVFYIILGVGVNLLLRWWLRQGETARTYARRQTALISDPYEIAHLRGGTAEALRVALVSLIDRGLLKSAGTTVIPARPDAERLVRRPLEQAIVGFFCSGPHSIEEMFKDPALRAEADGYATSLTQQGLLRDTGVVMSRLLVALPATVLLAGTGVTKVVVALSRGRYNVGFLIILTIVFTILVLATVGRRRTAAGDTVMRQLKQNYAQLKTRAKGLHAGGATNEAAMAAAVFGLAVLPPAAFPYVREMFPKASQAGTSGSSCAGSGCSGGGSSSDGGGGGGGCCGGGGGGCGGCGGGD